MKREWREFEESCPNCGDIAEVHVMADNPPGFIGDDDTARCRSCGLAGCMTVTDDEAYVRWEGE